MPAIDSDEAGGRCFYRSRPGPAGRTLLGAHRDIATRRPNIDEPVAPLRLPWDSITKRHYPNIGPFSRTKVSSGVIGGEGKTAFTAAPENSTMQTTGIYP
jgi:hypothetical protein